MAESNSRLNILALCSQRLGNVTAAIRYYRLRLLAQFELGDPTQIADSLLNLAELKHGIGAISVEVALRQMDVALRTYQRTRYSFGEADAYDGLARLLRAEGRIGEAITHHRRAIELAASNHDVLQEWRLRHSFGVTLLRTGDREAAREMFTFALRLGGRARLPYPIALAQTGLGDCALPEDPGEARRLWESARATFAELEAPELAEVQQRLSVLGGEDHLRSAPGRETMVW
jgi:tetratricopeptide (TPR) repeat protein